MKFGARATIPAPGGSRRWEVFERDVHGIYGGDPQVCVTTTRERAEAIATVLSEHASEYRAAYTEACNVSVPTRSDERPRGWPALSAAGADVAAEADAARAEGRRKS